MALRVAQRGAGFQPAASAFVPTSFLDRVFSGRGELPYSLDPGAPPGLALSSNSLLAACELDVEAMNNGTLSLIRVRGILPDGLAFEMPDCDPLPAARSITESFPPLADRLTVYLGVPAYRPNAVNCTPPEARADVLARYSSDQHCAAACAMPPWAGPRPRGRGGARCVGASIRHVEDGGRGLALLASW